MGGRYLGNAREAGGALGSSRENHRTWNPSKNYRFGWFLGSKVHKDYKLCQVSGSILGAPDAIFGMKRQVVA